MASSKSWLTISIVLLIVYTVYVIWAKFAAIFGPPPVKLGDVGEFLLFLSVIITFAMQIFVEDAHKARNAGAGTSDHGGDKS